MTDLTYKYIAFLSLPVIIANVTLPVQGLIDVAIIGHLDSPDYLTAVGLVSQLFALLFVSFNFLQYASSGLSAQAIGVGDTDELQRVLLRALLLAGIIGGFLIISQVLWLNLGEWFFTPTANVDRHFQDYYNVRIWGAPFELANYAFVGWFAGQSRTKALFNQQLLISISNILFNLLFVLDLGWNVTGVALGTLLANALGCAYALYLASQSLKQHGQKSIVIDWSIILNRLKIFKLLRLNRDIWIRTTLLTLSFAWITRLSTQQGELILAGNIILLQLLTLSAFAIDGIAVTTESLVGQAYGRTNKKQLSQVVKKTSISALLIASLLCLLFCAIRPLFLPMMTNIENVKVVVRQYYGFAVFLPLVAVAAYQFDGIMFGLTANKTIRNSMLWVAVIFFPLSYVIANFFDNSGIWLSLYAFFILRGGILAWQYKKLLRTI